MTNYVINNGAALVASRLTGGETADADKERAEWLAASQAILQNTWDNAADEAFNELGVESAGAGCQVEIRQQ